MHSKVKKFICLASGEKLILIGSAALLPVIRIALWLFGLRRSQRFLSLATHGRNRGWPEMEIERLSYLVNVAANRGIIHANCLERSLLLWSLLRRRGFSGTIRIGVSNKAEQFKAHAWVELNGVVLNDRPDVAAEFVPFSGAIDLAVPAPALKSQSRGYVTP